MKPMKFKAYLKAIKKAGFVEVKGGGKGGHEKYAKGNVTLIVPSHGKEVPGYVVKQAIEAGVKF